MTEKQFQATIVQFATKRGWLIYHTYDARRSQPGYPDLCMVRDYKCLFRELKTDKGKLSEAQKEWGEALTKANIDYAVWRPSDMQAILKELF